MNKIPPVLKNFYLLVSIPYIFWMLFFAENNFVETWKLRKKYNEIKREEVYYRDKNKGVTKDLKELRTDKALLERYAREKYRMKKPEEDVYIIVKPADPKDDI